jgi:hypothetical protein
LDKILEVTKRESEVAYFNKNIATFRLVKLHKVDYTAWNTDTIRWLYEYLDLSEQVISSKSVVKRKESRRGSQETSKVVSKAASPRSQ